jgi:hypothetical protein
MSISSWRIDAAEAGSLLVADGLGQALKGTIGDDLELL